MKKWFGLCLVLAVLLTGCMVSPVPEAPIVTEPDPTVPSSPYAPEDFVSAGNFLHCVNGKTVPGIDVSAYQGDVDWPEVAASGVKFAFVRLGYRGYADGSLKEDAYARKNLEGASAAGIPVGAYFFSQAISVEEAEAEAAYALEILAGTELDLPLVFDWEYVSDEARTGQVDRETLTECTLAFCRAVENAGYKAMIYFNIYQSQELLELEALTEYAWWLAKYDMETPFPCRVDVWQYTDVGSIPGIRGNVDINLLFTDFGLGETVFGEIPGA